jgi:hypothetical protein
MNAFNYLPSYRWIWQVYWVALIAQLPVLIWVLWLARKTWKAIQLGNPCL